MVTMRRRRGLMLVTMMNRSLKLKMNLDGQEWLKQAESEDHSLQKRNSDRTPLSSNSDQLLRTNVIYGDYMPTFEVDEDKVDEINKREDKGALPHPVSKG